MPSTTLTSSPLAGGATVNIAYRELGEGPCPLVFLHGGWGYDMYPLGQLTPALKSQYRIVAPDRSGYGRSSTIDRLGHGFHHKAMLETLAVLDALDVDRAVWWGHSDGAVIAAMAGLDAADRVAGVILEGLHLFADKPRSRHFFERMATEPDSFGPQVTATLKAEHGEDRWRTVMRLDGEAWLELAARAPGPDTDLYGGRLATLAPPALVIHGLRDPRAEPGELPAILDALPNADAALYDGAGHSPHSGPATAADVADRVGAFLARIYR